MPAIAQVALPTVPEAVQLLAALTMPLGTFLVLNKPTEIRWKDVLRAVGGIILPGLLIIAMQGAIPVSATTLILGIMLGHIVTMMDVD